MSAEPLQYPQGSPLPVRVGIIFADLGKLKREPLKYILLKLNTLQQSVEFQIFDYTASDSLLLELAKPGEINSEYIRGRLPGLASTFAIWVKDKEREFDLAPSPPGHLVVISLARLHDNFYSLEEPGVSLQALGNWERSMAPPSILEFIVVLLMAQSARVACPALYNGRHFGTRGCLYDLTANLEDARYKALMPFICSSCGQIMGDAGAALLARDLERVLDLRWLGLPTDPHSPASILRKLGYDLFLTRGIETSISERLLALVRDEATKAVVKLAFAVLAALLLLRLNLRN